ncbi:hypothetical protein GmHk_17G049360 [Glycine max]|nr:hypothetical protein GmHk_17G049360 [Glycine max]
MAGAGDNSGVYHQLDGSQRLLLDAMTTQMQRLLNRNNEELYKRIEGLEHQMNLNAGRPYGGNRRVNDGSNRIEGSDPDAYLDWEMKIQHAFSYNDYPKEQKVNLAAATFSNYALVWWKKNQREMKREEGREIDTWTEMRRVMRKREVCDDQIIRREKREQERDNSEAPQRNRKRKSDTLERWSDTQERERVIILIS